MSTCEDVRLSLGVYLLGALGAQEAVLVEAHLATCPECRAELEELSGLPAMLARVSEDDIEQVVSPPHDLLDRMLAVSARRRRMNRVVFGLAASLIAVVLAGTGWMVTGGFSSVRRSAVAAPTADSPNAVLKEEDAAARSEVLAATPTRPARPAESPPARLNKVDGGTPGTPVKLWGQGTGGVRADLTLVPGAKGTAVEVELSGIPAGTVCRLTAIATDGARFPAGGWTVGEDYAGGVVSFAGWTELTLDRIGGFDIRSSTGERLVSISRS